MVSSTRLWREENTRMFDAEIEEWEKRTAMQFIYLYGSKCPGATWYEQNIYWTDILSFSLLTTIAIVLYSILSCNYN